MFSLFKVSGLVTAITMVTVTWLVSSHEFSDLPRTAEQETVVSPFARTDSMAVEPFDLLHAAISRDRTIDVNAQYTLATDGTTAGSLGSSFAATPWGPAIDATASDTLEIDETTAEPPGSSDSATPREYASDLNIPYLLPTDDTSTTETVPPPNFTVAFIGDQGLSGDALAVLELIKSEGADMVLHQGDFDYSNNPSVWDQRINDALGPDFPYFASVGNHDALAWNGYQRKLADRLARIPGANCTGDLGVKSSCRYRGLFFILSGAGTMGTSHEVFIREELARSRAIWRICSWHKNQRRMQIGGKSDATGWGVYEACREGGAIIATAHEHSYERTKTLISIHSQIVDPEWPNPQQVRVAPGASFVFVSGLGGKSVRDQARCLPSIAPYGCNGEWASVYSLRQGATHGALFCSFNFAAQPDKARCYFKDIGGIVPDEFTITNFVSRALQ